MMLPKGTMIAVADGEKLNLFRNTGDKSGLKGVLDGKIEGVVVIAAPRALGEMRKHDHKALTAKPLGEIAKDLTGHSIADVATAILAA